MANEPDRSGGAGTTVRWLTAEKVATFVIAPILVAAVGAAITWWVNQPRTDLEIVDIAVLDGSIVNGQREGEFEIVSPRVQIAIRNVGDQVSVVEGARLEILDHAFFDVCEAGGALMVSQTYDVTLPLDPEPNQVLNVDVAQEIEPAQADRFEFSMQVPEPEDVVGTHMYRVRISLTRDGASETLDAGVVVLGAPHLAVETLWITDEDLEIPGPVGACYRELHEEYLRVRQWEGERSQQLMAAPEDILRHEPPG
ncbi:hypothetical protein LY71_1144 [Geodermatophilus tzadiensis]|uniref:Uncharacterized protein n=1 Tax=Geodermatophilus tzadiensis TaxID=1137988 RepID=A0A2T0TNS2_9ACTN|nr:hypothetical protein [Geodermatophilus tzadiensis]PRY47374.1 hypothetical protein LY71_1144 [Geodermatophilus tzadiensis]